jgi:glycosyltransferase involved in cell wall biosynthesis
MRSSIVCTVLNEEKTIANLLDSLLSQSKKPDEIVIVDGGSKDETVDIIKKYQKRNRRIKLFIKKGSSIAQGRNESIKHAKGMIIAQIDGGCIAKKDWFEKITDPFKNKDVEFVAGFYHMTGKSNLQKASALFLGVTPKKFNKRKFLPSARSMAFTKNLWKKVGGFSEKFGGAGEDTYFNYCAIKRGVRIVRVKSAVVYWQVPRNLNEIIKKFYFYARGDAEAGVLWNPIQGRGTHSLKIIFIFARYVIGILILFKSFTNHIFLLVTMLLVFLYFSWSILKMKDLEKNWNVRVNIPIIQLVSDFAVMAGFLSGLLKFL